MLDREHFRAGRKIDDHVKVAVGADPALGGRSEDEEAPAMLCAVAPQIEDDIGNRGPAPRRFSRLSLCYRYDLRHFEACAS
jgi:hypothetical protein